MHLSFTFFNLISVATLAVLGGVSAQDEGPNYVFKCKTPGEVALTFDDGPSPFTPKLLEYLKAADVVATFFVLGTAAKAYPDAIKATYNAGHQIALHSNTHADMNTLTPAKILDEYTQNLNAVKTTCGVSPKMARPPFGNCNAACAKVLEGQMGLSVIQWNCDSNDWVYDGKVADHPKLFTNMQTIINPSNPKTDSFITLQHDIKDYSVEYTPKIIDMIKAKGYTFVTVEKCTGLQAYEEGSAAAPAAAAPAAAPAGKKAPAPPSAPAPAPAPAAADAAYPSAPAPTAAFAESPTPSSTSSADKITSAFGLNLVGLIFGLLMY